MSLFFSCVQGKKELEPTVAAFEKEVYDFGVIPFGQDVPIEIKFSNKGENILKIKNVKTSCGCTVPKLTKTEVTTGNEAVVNIMVKPTRRGKFTSSVYVFYNGADSPKRIRIKGEIDYLDLLETE